MLLEPRSQMCMHLHHLVEADKRPQCRRTLAAAVGIDADAGSQHRAERRHVAAARRGEEGLRKLEAALLLDAKARSRFAHMGASPGGELLASGGFALDCRRDFLERKSEQVVQQERRTLERREAFGRKHQRGKVTSSCPSSSTTNVVLKTLERDWPAAEVKRCAEVKKVDAPADLNPLPGRRCRRHHVDQRPHGKTGVVASHARISVCPQQADASLLLFRAGGLEGEWGSEAHKVFLRRESVAVLR